MDKDLLKLTNAKINKNYKIKKIECDIKLKRRLLELGLCKDTIIKVINISPLKNSFLLELRGFVLAVRKNCTDSIFVENYGNE